MSVIENSKYEDVVKSMMALPLYKAKSYEEVMYFVRHGKFPVVPKVSDKLKSINTDIYSVGM